MARYNLKELDAGQLEAMWNFLRFHKGKLNPKDIDGLEENLNAIRQLMVQKTGGQEKYADAGQLNMNDLGTYTNNVVICAMEIMLSGGLDILKTHCEAKTNALQNK